MFSKTLTRQTVVSLAMVTAVAVTTANAATITGSSLFLLPGASTGSTTTGINPAPNNDNAVGASPNLLPFSVFLNAGGLGIMETEYVVANSGGTTEYQVTQTLINLTGTPWTDFHFELGFGTGANFVRSGALDFLDFDTPDRDPTPTSSRFSILNHQTDTLDWSGGIVPFGAALFTFAIDVPDNLSQFHPGGLNRFTLRQFPTTAPEPGLMVLVAVGLGAAGVRRWRRRG